MTSFSSVFIFFSLSLSIFFCFLFLASTSCWSRSYCSILFCFTCSNLSLLYICLANFLFKRYSGSRGSRRGMSHMESDPSQLLLWLNAYVFNKCALLTFDTASMTLVNYPNMPLLIVFSSMSIFSDLFSFKCSALILAM